MTRLTERHGLTAGAATNLLQYLDDQQRAVGAVPDDRTIVVERSTDDVGDWRLSVLSPFGSRVHAPWAMAVAERLQRERGIDADVMWADDGFVVRIPEGDEPPDSTLLIPDPDEVDALVVARARRHGAFRRASAKPQDALLLRRRPGQRHRSGSSASGRPTCWPWRPGSVRSRSCSRAYRECLR
jgi:ATP-dependent Lhr-like helicase